MTVTTDPERRDWRTIVRRAVRSAGGGGSGGAIDATGGGGGKGAGGTGGSGGGASPHAQQKRASDTPSGRNMERLYHRPPSHLPVFLLNPLQEQMDRKARRGDAERHRGPS